MHNTSPQLTPSDHARPYSAGALTPALSHTLLRTLTRIVLVLLGIQAVRAVITILLWFWLRPEPQSPLWHWIDLAAFTITGTALLVIFRPSAASLGLEWRGTSRLARGLTIGFGALALTGIITSGLFEARLLLENIHNALLFPILEEPLFRGWAWGQVEKTLKGKYAGLLTWLLNSALFALWHLGYFDVYLLKALPANPNMNLAFFVLMKLAVTFVIGLMVGFLRMRSQRLYGSMVLHALINLFGR